MFAVDVLKLTARFIRNLYQKLHNKVCCKTNNYAVKQNAGDLVIPDTPTVYTFKKLWVRPQILVPCYTYYLA